MGEFDAEVTSSDAAGRRRFLTKSGIAAAAVAATATVGVATAPSAAAVTLVPAYLPIGPFRVYDSRNSGDGPIYPGQVRYLGGDFGNTDFAQCFNVTVTQTNASGWLSVYPGDTEYAGTSSINWFASGQTLANNAFTQVAADDAGINIYCGGSGATQFILDLVAVVTAIDLDAVNALAAGAPAPMAATNRQPTPTWVRPEGSYRLQAR